MSSSAHTIGHPPHLPLCDAPVPEKGYVRARLLGCALLSLNVLARYNNGAPAIPTPPDHLIVVIPGSPLPSAFRFTMRVFVYLLALQGVVNGLLRC